MTPIFYEVATVTEPGNGPAFFVARVDTDKRVADAFGEGVEGIVSSVHWTKAEAESAAEAARESLPPPPPSSKEDRT